MNEMNNWENNNQNIGQPNLNENQNMVQPEHNMLNQNNLLVNNQKMKKIKVIVVY